MTNTTPRRRVVTTKYMSLVPTGSQAKKASAHQHIYYEIPIDDVHLSRLGHSYQPQEEAEETDRTEYYEQFVAYAMSRIPEILTPRQLEILTKLQEGRPQVSAADLLGIDQSSVSKSMRGTMQYHYKAIFTDPADPTKKIEIRVPYDRPISTGGSFRRVRTALLRDEVAVALLERCGIYERILNKIKKDSTEQVRTIATAKAKARVLYGERVKEYQNEKNRSK